MIRYRYRFTFACVLIMFLVLSSSLTFQQALATPPPPTVTFTSAFTSASRPPGASFSNGDRIPVLQGESSMMVTISFQGTDTNDDMRRLECRWSGGNIATPTSLSSSNCNLYQTVSGRTATSRVERNVAVNSNPYVLEVRGVDTSGTAGNIYRFTFTVTPPAPLVEICGDGIDNNRNGRIDEDCLLPPANPGVSTATIRLLSIIADYQGDITNSRRTTSSNIIFNMGTSNAQRVCTGFDSDPTDGISPTYNLANCGAPMGNVYGPMGLTDISYRFRVTMPPSGPITVCAIAIDSNNRYSVPLCTTVNRISGGSTPPGIEITSAQVYTGAGVSDLPNNGGTQYNNAHFIFRAIPADPSRSVSDATFECSYDLYPIWAACGGPIPMIYCGPVKGDPVIRCSPSWTLLTGLVSINNIPEGWHTLEVRAMTPDSIPGPETRFTWCVRGPSDRCISSGHPEYRPITASNIGLGGMLPAGSGVNDTLIFTDADLNRVVIENQRIILSGGIYAVSSGNLDNKTKTSGIQSVLWQQTEGPEVKFNSSTSQAIEFTAPSVQNDTLMKLRFTVTDSTDNVSTDNVSLFVVTKENAQKYNGTFCDAIVTKVLEYINQAKQIVLDNNGNDNNDKAVQANIENAKKYLTECNGSLNQYSEQLGNITETIPELNMTGFPGLGDSSVTDNSNINIPSATNTSQAGVEGGKTGTSTGETGTGEGGVTKDEGTGKTEGSKEGQSGDGGGGGGTDSSSDPSIDMPAEPGQDLTGGEKQCGPNEDHSKTGCVPEIPG